MDAMKVVRFLKRIEWSSSQPTLPGGHGSGQDVPACPACHNAQPESEGLPEEYIGHKKNCALVRLVSELKASVGIRERRCTGKGAKTRELKRQKELRRLAIQLTRMHHHMKA